MKHRNPTQPIRSILTLATLTLVACLTACAPKREVWLPNPKGPFLLGSDTKVERIGVEDPPGSGTIIWIDGPVTIPKGYTVLWYDWSRPVTVPAR